MRRLTIIVLAAALLGGVAGGAIQSALGDSTTRSPRPTQTLPSGTSAAPVAVRKSRALTPEEIYRRDAPAVVVITATETQRVPPTFFTPPSEQQVRSLGSGFVIDTKGDIVTNEHVVQGATSVRVGFSSGASYPAKVMGADASSDLAVVRVDAPPSALHPLEFADSSRIQVGDPVYAIGNPFGLDRTMTEGIVSATGRDLKAPNGLAIEHAIQTDAPINHGNSGGPLLNRFGEVIGINAQIESGGTVDGNVGVGFAIPSDTARAVVPQLIAKGHAEHAWLGVEVENIDPVIASAIKGVPSHGVLVVGVVNGSPAARAGLRAGSRLVTVGGESARVGGDAIVSIGGRSITSAEELATLLAAHRPGDRLELAIVRGGRSLTVAVTLGSAPNRI
jgi:S1-C subfamily serine protease